jgi:plasminogen
LRCAGSHCNPSNVPDPIVNGKNAESGEYPWQVHLRNSAGSGFCGGSILNRDWILTAAHCVQKNGRLSRQPSQLYIGVGFYLSYGTNSNIKSRDRKLGQDFIRSKKIIVHPCYDGNNIYNDIALIQLSKSINYGVTSQTIRDQTNFHKTWTRPICIPTPELTKELIKNRNDNCWVTGWGATHGITNPNEGDPFNKYGMQEGKIPLDMSIQTCEAKLGPGKDLKGDLSQICSMTLYGSPVDTCQGDSGGPYVCQVGVKNSQFSFQKFVQVGATSWGYGCAEKTPGVYTRVSHYIGWIAKYTKNFQVVDSFDL